MKTKNDPQSRKKLKACCFCFLLVKAWKLCGVLRFSLKTNKDITFSKNIRIQRTVGFELPALVKSMPFGEGTLEDAPRGFATKPEKLNEQLK